MLTVYIVCGVAAVGLILLSALGGAFGADVDAGSDVDIDVDHELDFEHDLGGSDAVELDASHAFDKDFAQSTGVWIPFLSLRFWIYFAAAFGLVGAISTLLKVSQEPTILISSIGTGLVMGLIAAWIFRKLRMSSTSAQAEHRDFMGKSGQMVVASRGGEFGKVRVDVKGSTIDLLATHPDGRELNKGESVYIVSIEGHKAQVMNEQEILEMKQEA